MFLNVCFGCVESQTCIGVAGTNTIERYYDACGRDAGYALNGVRQSTLAYDAATGRLSTMRIGDASSNWGSGILSAPEFSWNYLAGSDLKSSLTYPNGLTASWTNGNRGELLEVNNASPTGTISKYAYTYDAAGRRVACAKSGTAFEQSDSVNYGYNTRSELTSATAAVDSDYSYGYNFDDIGNRKTSSERGTNSVYTASQLNQYTAVDDFTPTYDADGNETLVKTATGIWQVSYNGENRPVRWAQGDTVITMSFDRMGRRVTKNDQRFVYNGYLQIANFRSTTTTSDYNYFVWDPTEPVATRPLAWLVRRSLGEGGQRGTSVEYYTHDGNKNVSEVIASNNDVAAHYEYAPFGALTVSRGTSAATNPWRFSSEYAEDDTATVYYNYRHYEPLTGRWMQRDPIEDLDVVASSNDYDKSQDEDQDFRVYLLRFAKVSFLYGDMAGYDKAMEEYFENIADALETKSDNYGGSIFNLYSHVGNASYIKFDELGLVGYGAVGVAAGCALADGPLPFGEIVGAAILVCCLIDPPAPPKCPDPPPLTKKFEIHYVPNQHGCPYAHWHKFEVHQGPWPLCKSSIKRSLGGCIPPKPGQPEPPIK